MGDWIRQHTRRHTMIPIQMKLFHYILQTGWRLENDFWISIQLSNFKNEFCLLLIHDGNFILTFTNDRTNKLLASLRLLSLTSNYFYHQTTLIFDIKVIANRKRFTQRNDHDRNTTYVEHTNFIWLGKCADQEIKIVRLDLVLFPGPLNKTTLPYSHKLPTFWNGWKHCFNNHFPMRAVNPSCDKKQNLQSIIICKL